MRNHESQKGEIRNLELEVSIEKSMKLKGLMNCCGASKKGTRGHTKCHSLTIQWHFDLNQCQISQGTGAKAKEKGHLSLSIAAAIPPTIGLAAAYG